MTTTTALVSVILPTHNRAELLRRAVRSVLAQTHEHLELIVIDDASSDHTAAVINEFDDPRLQYVRLDHSHRAAAARNIGIGMARGHYIAFQDDDDIWLVDKLRVQVEALGAAPEEVGMNIAGYFRYFPRHFDYIGGQARFERMDFRNGPLQGFALIATPGWLVKREILLAAGGFDPAVRSWDDWELAYRLHKLCRFQHIEQPLYIQDRAVGGGMWNNAGVYAADMQLIIDKHSPDLAQKPGVLASWLRVAGRYEAQFGSPRQARALLTRSLRLDARQKRTWLFLLSSLFGRRVFAAASRVSRRLHLLAG